MHQRGLRAQVASEAMTAFSAQRRGRKIPTADVLDASWSAARWG
jgi:hypothetical protein